MPTVERVTEITPEVLEAFERLIPQLSSSNPAPTQEQLDEIIASPATVLFLARDDEDQVVGSLTLATFRIPTGTRAWIEDVVVELTARGQGIGEALNQAAIAEARERGCITVDLTSRPTRESANRLYRRMGFEQRDTNVYRFTV